MTPIRTNWKTIIETRNRKIESKKSHRRVMKIVCGFEKSHHTFWVLRLILKVNLNQCISSFGGLLLTKLSCF